MKGLSGLCSLSLTIFLLSCATPRIEPPVYEGVDVRHELSSKSSISAIEATFSIIFEKDNGELKGDGVLNISKEGNLILRIYSLGFLALELTSEKGIVKSTPGLDRNKGTILVSGLRDCLFWWDIQDFDVNEKENLYLIKNQSRMIWMDRKTLLPMKQTISLEDGRDLDIFYEGYERVGDIWYPLRIKIELSGYSVTLRFKDISFIFAI